MNRYKKKFPKFFYVQKLDEGINLSDLKKHSGISNLTKSFMVDRRKIVGGGNQSAKLIDCVVNKKKNYVEFQFLSEPTYDEGEINNVNDSVSPHPRETQPKSNFSLKKTNTYEQDIRILNFFEWLDVFEGEKITRKNLKEILNVSDIQVWCYCPSLHWQGMSYYLSTAFDASIYPTNIAPKFWNRKEYHGDGNALICKHLDLIFASIDFFLNPMSSMLTKKLKDRNYI